MKIITFYSFKGGSGRSSSVYNTIPFLADELNANKDHPILLLDMDFDSAGMTYLLNKYDYFAHTAEMDLVDIIMEGRRDFWVDTRIADHPFFGSIPDVSKNFELDDGTVLFIGVNDTHTLDLRDENVDDVHLHRLIQGCQRMGFRAVVIDSSSGIQTTAQMATSVADVLVCCLKATFQFRMGTFRYLHDTINRYKSFTKDMQLIILPVAVPNQSARRDGCAQTERDYALSDILQKTEEINHPNINKGFLCEESFGVPEIESFKWEERMLYKKAKREQPMPEDETFALAQFKKLAVSIVQPGN